MRRVPVSEHFVISAVRYALGRSTYIVGETVDEVLRVWPELSGNTRKVIARDVSAFLTYDHTGMACDAADWMRLWRRCEQDASQARLSSPQTDEQPFPGVPGPVGDESTRRTS